MNLSFAMVLAVTVAACELGRIAAEPGRPPREGVLLLAGAKSYSSPDEVKAQFAASGGWRVTSYQPSSGNSRPRFSQLTVEVGADECGQTGTLQFQFINELLVSASFTPQDLATCREQLKAKYREFSEVPFEDGIRRYWIATASNAKAFIGMSDARLQAEVTAWIRAYS